jgi:hypothetical protein
VFISKDKGESSLVYQSLSQEWVYRSIDLWICCGLSAGKKSRNIVIGFVILLSFYRFCLLATNFLVYLLTCTLLIQLLAYCIDNFFVWIFQMMINILYHLVTVLHCCDGDKKDSSFV